MSGGSGNSVMKCFPCFLPPSTSTPTTYVPEGLPPNEFCCPISGFLMEDPIIVPTGHTFERACIEACKELYYIPPPLLSSSSSSSTNGCSLFFLVPNLSLRAVILDWCERVGHPPPYPVSQHVAHCFVKRLMEGGNKDDGSTCASVAKQSVAADPFEERNWMDLLKPRISDQIRALDAVHERATTRDRGVSLCTPRIMAAIVPKLWSDDGLIQTNAGRVILAFSKAPHNRIRIVGCGAVPSLLHVLANGINVEAREHAAITIGKLAEEEKNRMVMGALGAVPPLLEKFCDRLLHDNFVRRLLRREAATALYYLVLCRYNLAILANMRAIPRLLEIATDSSNSEATELRAYAMRLLHRLAGEDENIEDLIRGEAVELMLRELREGKGVECYCLGVLQHICTNSPSRFRTLAINAGADKVLPEAKGAWGEDGRRMASTMLKVIQEVEAKTIRSPGSTE